MKRLFLLRHAKTEPHSASIEDRERELMPRGREDAPLVGHYMSGHGYRPDLIFCSTARRTVETLALLVPELSVKPPVEYLDALYLAEPELLLAHMEHAPDKAKALLLLGHNPGLEQMAGYLSRAPIKRKEQSQFDLMEEKFPTGALAVLDFAVTHWADVEPQTGTLVDFVRPRDLR